MSTEDNKNVIREHFAAMERGDLDEAASYWSADGVNHASGRTGKRPPPGPEGLIGVLRSLRLAYPDRRWQIDDLIAEGDMVSCRMTVSGTYGEIPPIRVESAWMMETAPTGKPYSNVHQVHVFRVVDGKLTEHWAVRDDFDLLLQLGVISPPDAEGGEPGR